MFNVNDIKGCQHEFVRIDGRRVQCIHCGIGFYDDPSKPFPIEKFKKKPTKKTPERKNA